MEKNEIMQALNGIFSAVLNQSNLQLSENMTTDDIENWDSLTNMTIISEIEKRWNIHFKLSSARVSNKATDRLHHGVYLNTVCHLHSGGLYPVLCR